MFINGEWCQAESGKKFGVINPATGEGIGDVADGGQVEAKRAIQAAHSAFSKYFYRRPCRLVRCRSQN